VARENGAIEETRSRELAFSMGGILVRVGMIATWVAIIIGTVYLAR